jgi:putative hydrolase of the HAD superfamily
MPTHAPVIAFDADDTLWHNETIFEDVHARYRHMLAQYHDAATVERTLFATEMRNLDLYGYGVKGFTLSALETAIELSHGNISTNEISQLIALGRDMLAHPVELLPGVADTLASLASTHRLLVITKGDLRDQERKIAKSGLAEFFGHTEIVSDKNADSYASILRRHAISASSFVMVGNSLKSDILPVLSLGGTGVHIPYHLTWEHERAEPPPVNDGRFFTVKTIRELPSLLPQLGMGG